MKLRGSFDSKHLLRRSFCVALGCATFGAFSTGAYADVNEVIDPGTITITAPRETVVGRDYATNAPIIQVNSTARVRYEPMVLTTNSGVALLKYRVTKAAREMCTDLDPLAAQDWSCVRRAVDEAQPQIDAAIARAEAAESSSS